MRRRGGGRFASRRPPVYLDKQEIMQPPPLPPHTPTRPSGGLKFAIFAGVGGVLFIGLFLAIWQFLSPAERKVVVPFSTFIEDVHAGRVQEIRVVGRDIDYRLTGPRDSPDPAAERRITKHTTGPVPDQAFLDTLKPENPNTPPPKIYFEK